MLHQETRVAAVRCIGKGRNGRFKSHRWGETYRSERQLKRNSKGQDTRLRQCYFNRSELPGWFAKSVRAANGHLFSFIAQRGPPWNPKSDGASNLTDEMKRIALVFIRRWSFS